MIKYELTEQLLTGHSVIDTQHKELFNAINNLMDACAAGKGRNNIETTFNFLQNYTTKHFNDEERLQYEVNYPYYEDHKKLHNEYKVLSQSAGNTLINEGPTIKALSDLNAAISALISHVKIHDKKLADYISSKQ